MIHFSDVGSGKPILLLHGFCENHQIWSGLTAELASEYRVISLDLPGFGKSSHLPENIDTIEDIADVLFEELAELQLEELTIVGHSLGGYVTLALAELYPELVESVVLVNSTTFADSSEKRRVRNKVIRLIAKHGVEPFINQFVDGIFYDKDAFIAAYNAIVEMGLQCKKESLVRYSAIMRDRPDRTFLLHQSDIPIMIIAGAEDSIVPVGQSQEMIRSLPKNQGKLLEACGHMTMYEQPERLYELMKYFLNKG